MSRRAVAAAWAEAPAKVNLGLAVTGRRPDGYHTLRSVFLRLALHDHLEVGRAADPAGPDELVIVDDAAGAATGPGGGTKVGAASHLTGPENLILRAVAALRSADPGHRRPALRFRLDKHIPVAAGLAGGSSRRCCRPRACRRRMGPGRGPLGAPGPGGDAGRRRAVLRGEPPGGPRGRHRRGHRGAAGAASARRDPARHRGRPPADSGRLRRAGPHRGHVGARRLAPHDPGAGPDHGHGRCPGCRPASRPDGAALADLAPALREANDLWPAASRLSPRLEEARGTLEARLERPVLLSGSGPTLVAIYPSLADAGEAARDLDRDRPSVLRGATITATSSSPRGGTS